MDIVRKKKDIAALLSGKEYVYQHTVLLNETNAMGGVVYFANLVKWQGMARESLLCQHPKFKEIIARPVEMITHSCSVDFLKHLYFGDVVQIKLRTKDVKPSSFVITFRYIKEETGELIATGQQKVTFADQKTGQLCRVPQEIHGLAKSLEENEA